MNSYRFFTTDQYFDDLNFHDCHITYVKKVSNDLFIELEYIYVSDNHPLNPNATAKSTDQCRMIFKGVSSVRAELYVDANHQSLSDNTSSEQASKLEARPVEPEYFNKMEIETFNIDRTVKDNTFNLQGLDWKTHEFCGLIIQSKGFIIEWNNFLEDAWYVNWEGTE